MDEYEAELDQKRVTSKRTSNVDPLGLFGDSQLNDPKARVEEVPE